MSITFQQLQVHTLAMALQYTTAAAGQNSYRDKGDTMDKRLVDGYLSKTAELLDTIEGKVRRVRDPNFWGKPYGTPITPGMKPTKPTHVDINKLNVLRGRENANAAGVSADDLVDEVRTTVREDNPRLTDDEVNYVSLQTSSYLS